LPFATGPETGRLSCYGLGGRRLSTRPRTAVALGYPERAMRAGSILGHPVRRVEDPDLLTGASRFTADVIAQGALHAVFVRSTVAHGRLTGVDASQAATLPGVAGVFT